MWTTFFRHQENLSDGLVDNSRRYFIFFFVKFEDKSPLTSRILLLFRITVWLAFILLFKQTSRFFVARSNEMLHLHDKHLHLLTLTEDVADGNHLYGFSVLSRYTMFLVSMIGLIAQNLQQLSVEVMCLLDGILYSWIMIDDEILVFIIVMLKPNKGRTKIFYILI